MSTFFKLKENKAMILTETMAEVAALFAMGYILLINPSILSETGVPFQIIFLATIITSITGTLITGLFANIPHAQAPGMGLNTFFTFTVVFGMGYAWRQALIMAFICSLVSILIVVAKIRKMIIKAIPESLRHVIGGGIGISVAYVGSRDASLPSFTVQAEPQNGVVNGLSIVPALRNFDNPAIILMVVGLILTTILAVASIRGVILTGIVVTTLVAIPIRVIDTASVDWHANSLGNSFKELGTTSGVAFGAEGLQSLFSSSSKIPQALMTIIVFSLSDAFDTIGTFIGTGRRTGIFSEEDELALEDSKGFSIRVDKVLLVDVIVTSIGAILDTSNTTTYVESATGIGAGGRTGLTSVVVTILFALNSLFSLLIAIVPAQATAPVLILVGVMMLASFKNINWTDLEDAIPAFSTSIFTRLCYSTSYGIIAGFTFYAVMRVVKGKVKEVSPIVWVIDALSILNFVILAILQ